MLFNYFMATLTAEIRAAKEEGRYSEGVSDLPVTNIHRPPEPQVRSDIPEHIFITSGSMVPERAVEFV